MQQSGETAASRRSIKEIHQLIHNETWLLVEPPPNTNIVGCKWVLKLKAMPDGSVKHKARLVAQGFTQKPGVDYDETYSPVVRFASLRALFALAAHYDWMFTIWTSSRRT